MGIIYGLYEGFTWVIGFEETDAVISSLRSYGTAALHWQPQR